MKKKKVSVYRLPVILFAVVLVAVLACALRSVSTIVPLYTDADLRNTVQREVQAYADEHGLLLSSITIVSVQRGSMQLAVREYRRGFDAIDTVTVPLPALP